MYFQSSVFRSHSILISQADPVVFYRSRGLGFCSKLPESLFDQFLSLYPTNSTTLRNVFGLVSSRVGEQVQNLKTRSSYLYFCVLSVLSLGADEEGSTKWSAQREDDREMSEGSISLFFLNLQLLKIHPDWENKMEHSVSSCSLGREKVL